MSDITELDGKSCAKPGCPFGQTGECAEGHDPVGICPFLSATTEDNEEDEDSTDSDDEDETDVPVESTKSIALPSGEVFSVADADVFLRGHESKIVAIVGDRGAGKTTLLCSIYEQFLRGPFAGFYFAGSRTLIGFERRVHFSRVDSGLKQPQTPRTSRLEGLHFYHLCLSSQSAPEKLNHLMIADRAGEVYQEARASSENIPSLIEIGKASIVVFLLDSEKLVDPEEIANGLQSVRQSLRAFLDSEALTKTSIVQIVTTKLDLLEKLPKKGQVRKRVCEFLERIAADFAPRLSSLSFWEISARDPSGGFAPALGVDRLLQSWMEPVSVTRVAPEGSLPALLSQFDKMVVRTPGMSGPV